MHEQRIAFRLLAVIALLVFIEVAGSTHVYAVPAVAIVVYDHGFVKSVSYTARGHFLPVNKTSTFNQDDSFVVAYFTAALSTANVTWKWYDPDAQLYVNETRQYECAVAPCSFVYYFYLANGVAAAKTGTWRLDVLAGGILLYSDSFSISPVVTQGNFWNFTILQSAPGRVHGDLNVVIHPDNLTWSSYSIYMPYAANITAYESGSNRMLKVKSFNDSRVIVDFGGFRSDGYRFVLSFDLKYGLRDLSGWDAGNFALTWRWSPSWLDVHPNPVTFRISLPKGAKLVDTAAVNLMKFNASVAYGNGSVIFLKTTLPPRQSFGWTIIYQDLTWRESHPIISPSTPSAVDVNLISQQLLPILPVTLGGVSLWSAIMSVFLLTGSELLSSIYARTGILIDRRRLRIAALILVAVFLVTTAYQLMLAQSSIVTR